MRKLMNFKTIVVLIFLGFVFFQTHQLFQFEITPIFSFFSSHLIEILIFTGTTLGYALLVISFYLLAIYVLLIIHDLRYFDIKKEIKYQIIQQTYTSLRNNPKKSSTFRKLEVMRC